jgi:hypothetical protein
MGVVTLLAVATPNKSLIGTNCVYAAAADIGALGVKDGGFIQVKSMVFTVMSDEGERMRPGYQHASTRIWQRVCTLC